MWQHWASGKIGFLEIRIRTMDLVICWVLCTFFYGIGQGNAQTCPITTDMEMLTLEAVDTRGNITFEEKDWGSLSPLFRMSNLFLDAVQPNPLPEDLLRVALTNSSSLQTSRVVKYEAGYVTCAVIAVIFIIFMLVFGITYCTYQCRGRRIFASCDGVFCQRTAIFLGLIMTCCILFAGLVCSFYLNEKVQQEMGPGMQEIKQSIQDFRYSINSIPRALEKVVSEFSVPKLKVFDELQKFIKHVDNLVHSKLNSEIFPLLTDALATAKQLVNATQLIVDVNRTMTDLNQRQGKLLDELRTHKMNLQKVLSDPLCKNCSELAGIIQNLELGLNYSQILTVSEYVNRLKNVRKVNLTGIFQQGFQAMNKVPTLVNDKTVESVKETRITMIRTEKEIKDYVSTLPLQKYMGPVNKALLNLEETSERYGNEVERYEYYRWVIGIVLCTMILLIVVCTFLGLFLGIYGLYTRSDPSAATVRRTAGYQALIVEIYLSFSFSWLLVIFVFLIFLVGGNVQTLMCKHWANGDLYRFLDKPENLPPNLNLKRLFGLKESSNLSDLYQECYRGAPIWDVLQFNSSIDFDSLFNISKYTGDLQSKIEDIPVDMDALDLFVNIAVLVLSDYKNSGLDRVPASSIMEQIQEPLLKVDIEPFVSALETFATIQSDPSIKSQLLNEIASLKKFQTSLLQDQENDTKKLNASLRSLSLLTVPLQTGIDRAIKNVQTLQTPLITDFIEELKTESRCLLNESLGYFTQYMEWVKKTVIEDIASCRAFPLTLDRVRVVVCHDVTMPWNAFWFCLGWCTFFLIPNIILSIKSSEHIEPRPRLSMTL
ncbi:prominin-2 [Pelobates cultripes]|uniref:Prominin-2 n=1 Tax=Pelobates cultripes TaxID=61616 RepID=A0AAD1VZ53_PELCU|nr:prominin-2 [Pelobates cultripes]